MTEKDPTSEDQMTRMGRHSQSDDDEANFASLVDDGGTAAAMATVVPVVAAPAAAAAMATVVPVRPVATAVAAPAQLTDVTAPSKNALPDPIGVPVGDGYVIQRRIAQGGMGAVYVAEHPKLPTKRIIKVLLRRIAAHPEFASRFEGEAQAAATINHPNVVRVDGFAQLPDGRRYIKYEYIEGQTLQQLLATHVARHGTGLDVITALQILAQVCAGMEKSHSLLILHRDLKPGNLMLSRRNDKEPWHVTIIDFGIARLSQSVLDGELVAHTSMQTRMSTPRYCAPEQDQALHLATQLSDIYSIAVIAYEMVVGSSPLAFPADPCLARTDLPAVWRIQILRALSHDPSLRPKSVREFLMPLIEGTYNGHAAVSRVAASFLEDSISGEHTVRASVALGTPPPIPAPETIASGPRTTAAPEPATMSMMVRAQHLPPAPVVRSRRGAWVLAGMLLIVATAVGSRYVGQLLDPRPRPPAAVIVAPGVSQQPVAPTAPASIAAPLVLTVDAGADKASGEVNRAADAGAAAAETPPAKKPAHRKRRLPEDPQKIREDRVDY